MLIDSCQQTRENAAYAIKCLCKKHHLTVQDALLEAKSDGNMLLLTDIEINSILLKGQVMRGHGKVGESPTRIDIYNKRWLGIQRKILREKLGFESNNIFCDATKHTDEYFKLIDENDVCVCTREDSAMIDSIKRKPFIIVPTEKSGEAWIVRVMRNMVVGLLDLRWETRQGCSLGLIAIIESMFSYDLTPLEEISISFSSLTASLPLSSLGRSYSPCDTIEAFPVFLLEDIAATSICVLILDRFIAFDEVTSFESPVRNVVAKLIAFCCYGGHRNDFDFTEVIIDKVMDMISYSKYHNKKEAINYDDGWRVFEGGLLTLKQILLIQPSVAFSNFVSIASIIHVGLSHPEDNVQILTYELVISLEKCVLNSKSYWESKMDETIGAHRSSFCCRWTDNFYVCLLHLRDVNLRCQTQTFSFLFPILCSAIESCTNLLHLSAHYFINRYLDVRGGYRISSIFYLMNDIFETCQRILDCYELYSTSSLALLISVSNILVRTSLVWNKLLTIGIKIEFTSSEGLIRRIICMKVRIFFNCMNHPNSEHSDYSHMLRMMRSLELVWDGGICDVLHILSVGECEVVTNQVLSIFLISSIKNLSTDLCNGHLDIINIVRGNIPRSVFFTEELFVTAMNLPTSGCTAVHEAFLFMFKVLVTNFNSQQEEDSKASKTKRTIDFDSKLIDYQYCDYLIPIVEYLLRQIQSCIVIYRESKTENSKRTFFVVCDNTTCRYIQDDLLLDTDKKVKVFDTLKILFMFLLVISEGTRNRIDYSPLRGIIYEYLHIAGSLQVPKNSRFKWLIDVQNIYLILRADNVDELITIIGNIHDFHLGVFLVHITFHRIKEDLQGLLNKSSMEALVVLGKLQKQRNTLSKVVLVKLASLEAVLTTFLPLKKLIKHRRDSRMDYYGIEGIGATTLLYVIDGMIEVIDRVQKKALVDMKVPVILMTHLTAEEFIPATSVLTSLIIADDSSRNAMLQIIDVINLSIREEKPDLQFHMLPALMKAVDHNILSCYNEVLTVCMRGLKHRSEVVRQCCAETLNSLVVFASMARCRNIPPVNSNCFDLQKYLITYGEFPCLFPTSVLSAVNDTHHSALDLVSKLRTCTRDILENCVGFDRSACSNNAGTKKICLRDYQWQGVFWITHLRRFGLGAALCDEMGTGKTVQAILSLLIANLDASESMQKWHDHHPSLLICPGSLISHWMNEIDKFVVDTSILKPVRYRSENFMEDVTLYNGKILVLVSYSELTKHEKTLTSIQWNNIVLDEAHIIRTPGSSVAKAAFSLKAVFRIALTGTPLQTEIEGIWSIFNFIIPGFLGKYSHFEKDFILPIHRSLQCKAVNESNLFAVHKTPEELIEISAVGLEKMQLLRTQTSPFIMRRMKKDILPELPPKSLIEIRCPLSEVQKRMYSNFRLKFRISDELVDSKKAKDYFTEIPGSLPQDLKKSRMAYEYLELLFLHPALVISDSHEEYREHLLRQVTSSGKCLTLARLLEETGVVNARERAKCNTSSSTFVGEELVDDYLLRVWEQKREKSKIEVECEDYLMKNNRSDFLNLKPKFNRLNAFTQQNDGEGEIYNQKKIERGVQQKRSVTKIYVENPKKCLNSSSVENDSIHVSSQEIKHSQCNHKCLIFVQHLASMDVVERCVLQRFFPTVPYDRIDMSMSSLVRAKKIEEFNHGNDSINSKGMNPRILLMTTAAGGLGVSLTAADIVIFLEHAINPYIDMHAADRAHRFGQCKAVNVYKLIIDQNHEFSKNEMTRFCGIIFEQIINRA